MKLQLSQRQITLLAANTIIAGSLVILPQALTDLALQNVWLVPILMTSFLFLLVGVGLKGIHKVEFTADYFSSERMNYKKKVFLLLIIIFSAHVLIRDVRILTEFVEATLLPLTPIFIITDLVILVCLYIAWSGIEVISRFTELFFVLFIGVILFVPVSLVGDMVLENFEPVLGFQVIPSILQSTYIGLAWVGEVVILFFILSLIQPIKRVKKSIIIGGGIGLGLLLILTFSQIAILGAEIVRYTTYPSYTLVQQIRITEFLDRLDFILVSLYFPTIFAKISLFLYGLHRAFNLLTGNKVKITMLPIALVIGLFSKIFFENKVRSFDYQIQTWGTFGLVLELLIVLFMYLVIRETNKQKELPNLQNQSTFN